MHNIDALPLEIKIYILKIYKNGLNKRMPRVFYCFGIPGNHVISGRINCKNGLP